MRLPVCILSIYFFETSNILKTVLKWVLFYWQSTYKSLLGSGALLLLSLLFEFLDLLELSIFCQQNSNSLESPDIVPSNRTMTNKFVLPKVRTEKGCIEFAI